MRTFPTFLAISFLPLFLISCGNTTPASDQQTESSSSSSSEASVAETHNVIYSGRVRPSGISIYMEGTHRLELADGRFILLESTVVDLNGYVGELAEVTGTVRPTVEAGGTVMRVEQIRLIESGSSSESDTGNSASSSSTSSTSSAGSVATLSSVSSVAPASSASVAPVNSAISSIASKSSLSPAKSSTSTAASSASVTVDLSAQVASMAKQNMAASNWTQAYCTAHIGFCVSIHRNWFFQSFGAITGSLWHVEVSSAEMQKVGDGPLVIDLLPGTASSKGASDGEVRTSGDSVIGYKEWADGRHFEITAPAALKEAVQYMMEHLTPAEKSS